MAILMRVVALPSKLDDPCTRYRLAAFVPGWRRHGIDVQIASGPALWLPGLPFFRTLARADVVVVQRRLFGPWKLRLLRKAARYLVFDFDDAVYLRDSYHVRGSESSRRRHAFQGMMQAADLVLAGNSFLAEKASAWAPADKVLLAPTCVDPACYPLAEHRGRGDVYMAWIGSASTLRGLERIRDLLELFGKCVPGLNLKVICNRSVRLRHLPVHFCPWSQETEGPQLASADMGLSWLPDDEWSRGKCGLKVLQYMAAGLPVIANPVGPHLDLVRHGETGFLAESPAEWLAALDLLAKDAELRRRLGQAGRLRVERDFHVKRGAAIWLESLRAAGQRLSAASLLA